MKALSVVIVDDEADIRLLMEIWLEEAGHTVVAAAEGAAARACFGQKQFDLVVTDVLMPKTDGLGLIAEIKKVRAFSSHRRDFRRWPLRRRHRLFEDGHGLGGACGRDKTVQTRTAAGRDPRSFHPALTTGSLVGARYCLVEARRPA
ncbi:MAG: response regulator [Opitutus sp.]|nr:response regulator [Opitutus sp.]